MTDEECMRRTLDVSSSAVANGNHPFGAILVIDHKVVLEIENTVLTDKDVSRHAELKLVSIASSKFSEQDLKRAVLYTSTEPCAMCCGAIYWSKIGTVVYGCPAKRLDEIAGPSLACHSNEVFKGAINPPLVRGPLLEQAAAKQHASYWTSGLTL